MSMRVTLLSHTPAPERQVAAAARLCYSPVGAAELVESMNEEKVHSLVETITRLGHFSTLEHVSFTFAVEGVSRVLTHQLVRHRLASYSQQSQRYVKEHGFEYITPPTIRKKEELMSRYAGLMEEIQAVYDELVEAGVPAEDARYVLGNATETKILITMNARTLLHFFQLRLCSRAQWEIRTLAGLMREEVRKAAPLLFENAGPTCETEGRCSEGAMTCGRLEKMERMHERR